jgi:hypothetical protein
MPGLGRPAGFGITESAPPRVAVGFDGRPHRVGACRPSPRSGPMCSQPLADVPQGLGDHRLRRDVRPGPEPLLALAQMRPPS